MRIITPTAFQTYNDGICQIYRTGNIAVPGLMPKKGMELKYKRIPFEKRTIGVKRHYLAKQENVQLSEVIRIPESVGISTQDICKIGDTQYAIEQIQRIRDAIPASMDVSLRRLEVNYDIGRVCDTAADGNS